MGRTYLLILTCLPLLAAGPALPPLEPCGVDPTSLVPLSLEEGTAVASLDVASTLADIPTAVAIEALAPGRDMPQVLVRFAFGPASAPSTRWSWLPGASAVLGPGSGPSIARIPGDDPTWIVLFSRIESGGARPAAVKITPEEQARRLDLDEIVLDKSDHVFGPLCLPSGPGKALLIWGESHGAKDTIKFLAHPPGDAPPTSLASGSLADHFAAAPTHEGPALAWLEQDPSTLEGWTLSAAIHDGKDVTGPVSLSSHTADARILDLDAGPDGIRVHLLERDPLRWSPLTVTAAAELSGPGTTTSSGQKLSPGTSITGASVDGALVLAWLGTHRSMPGLWARSGNATWAISPSALGSVIDLCPGAHGLTAAWTETSRIVILRLALDDSDTDSIPDSADLCPDLPEPVNSTLDHDGCPDPPPTLGSPLQAARVWFPLPGPTCTLPHAPDAGLPDPRLPESRLPELVEGLPSETAEKILAGDTHAELGTLLAGPGGLLLRLDSPEAEPQAIKPPPGVKKNLPVSVVLGKQGIFVAWHKAGVFHRKGWKAKWTKISHANPDDPAARGARALARSSSGHIYLASRKGGLYRLAAEGWVREEAGLEGVWIVDAFTDPSTGEIVAVGIGGRPVLLCPHAVAKRVTVPAKHFTKSGKKAKKSTKHALAKVLGPITSGKFLVRLEGYTDSKGSDKSNLAMSLRRARALKKWLVARGADPAHIVVIGFGEAHPIAKPSSEKNRRVEVVLLEP